MLTHSHMAYPSLKYETIAVIAIAIGAIDAAADIGRSVDCLELRPLHVNSGKLLGCDLVDLGCDGSQHVVDIAHNLTCLSGVVGGCAKLTDDVGLSVNLGLHLALFEVAELVVNHRRLVGNRSGDSRSVAVSLTGQSVGLLDGANLCLISLLDGEELLLAAAVLECADYACVAGSDLVDNLRHGYRLLESEGAQSVLYIQHTSVDEVEILAECGGEVGDGGARSLTLRGDGIHNEFASAIVIELVGEESSGPCATAKAAAPVASVPSEHRSDDCEAEEVSDRIEGAEASAKAPEGRSGVRITRVVRRHDNSTVVCHFRLELKS